MPTPTKQGPPPRMPRPVQSPKRREARQARSWNLLAAITAALVVVAVVAIVLTQRHGGADHGVVAGLPSTPDYHALLVSRSDANTLLLGTHQGIYRSQDGGKSWS